MTKEEMKRQVRANIVRRIGLWLEMAWSAGVIYYVRETVGNKYLYMFYVIPKGGPHACVPVRLWPDCYPDEPSELDEYATEEIYKERARLLGIDRDRQLYKNPWSTPSQLYYDLVQMADARGLDSELPSIHFERL